MRTLLEMGLSNALLATLLALLAAAIGQLCRRPAMTHSLWLLVLLKLVTPPLLPVSLPWPESSTPADAEAAEALPDLPLPADLQPGPVVPRQALPEEAAPVVPLTEPPAGALVAAAASPEPVSPEAEAMSPATSWWQLAAPFWLAGSGLCGAWMLYTIVRFQRLLRQARPAPAELQLQVEALAQRLGLRRGPAVWLVPGAVSPMIWAIGKVPRLLFPSRLLERLDGDQLATLLVHELAHLRRRDHLVRFVEMAALALYWWHPVVWWARREIHEAEEQCCDAWVVWALAGAGRSYALALLQTVAFFSRARFALPMAASGIGPVPHLRRRLTMIMQAQTPRSLSWAGGALVTGLGLLLLPALSLQAQTSYTRNPTAARDSRDDEIEVLKRAIQILEAQKQADRERDKVKQNVDKEEIERTRAEVSKLQELANAKRKELQEVETKLKANKDHLRKLTGGGTSSTSAAGMMSGMMGSAGGSGGFGGIGYQDAGGMMGSGGFGGFSTTPPAGGGSQAGGRGQDKKSQDLEQKLDRLLKEVEALRKELRGQKSQGPWGGLPSGSGNFFQGGSGIGLPPAPGGSGIGLPPPSGSSLPPGSGVAPTPRAPVPLGPTLGGSGAPAPGSGAPLPPLPGTGSAPASTPPGDNAPVGTPGSR